MLIRLKYIYQNEYYVKQYCNELKLFIDQSIKTDKICSYFQDGTQDLILSKKKKKI